MEQFLLRAKVEEFEYLEGKYVSRWVEGYLNLAGITETGPKFTFAEPVKGKCVSHIHTKNGEEHYVYTAVEHSLYSKKTISRWTGLLDKNGKKIFEGDILKWETLGSNYIYLVVEFDNGGYIAKPCDPDMKHRKIRLGGEQSYCEVVGNRWDNPELLKGE